MKRIAKILVVVLLAFTVLTITSCGVSESYADKINDKAKAEKNLTFKQVQGKLGKNYEGGLVSGIGSCTWYQGCKSLKEANEKVQNGKTVKTISVQFFDNKAVSAEYIELQPKK